ncbi:MAG: HEAT repeat domain-containing protein [Planctomycetes bacterium]|nr:HEAT repeat domain-containing protein [Planctomycetota bacterium]
MHRIPLLSPLIPAAILGLVAMIVHDEPRYPRVIELLQELRESNGDPARGVPPDFRQKNLAQRELREFCSKLDEEAVPELAQLLRIEPDVGIRLELLQGIGSIAGSRSTRAIGEHLRQLVHFESATDPQKVELRRAVQLLMLRPFDADAYRALATSCEAAPLQTRGLLLTGMSGMPEVFRDRRRWLVELSSPDAATRLGAALAFADPRGHATEGERAEVTEAIAAQLDREEDPFVLPALIGTLSGLHHPSAVDPLARVCERSEVPRVREAAVEALIAIGSDRAADVLADRARVEENARVRHKAEVGAASIRGEGTEGAAPGRN